MSFADDVASHYDSMLAQALSYARHQDQAEDLVSETVLRALEREHQYKPGTGLRSWLGTILYTRFIDHCRRNKKDVEVRLLLKGLGNANYHLYDAETSFVEFDPEFIHAMQWLPEPFYDVLVLSDLHDLKGAEISDILDIPLGTVTSRLHRARKMMRERLAHYAAETGIIDETLPYESAATNYLHLVE